MGQIEADSVIASRQPTLHEFLNLCIEKNIAEFPQADQWGIHLLKECDFQERWRIIKVLPRVGPSIIEPLLAIAEDFKQDIELRWFAIRVLGKYRKPQVIARLVVMLDDCRDEFITDEIMRVLVQLQEKAVDYLVPLLAESEMRLLAVKALCKIRYPNIVEPLLGVVEDPNPEIRALSIDTLGGFRHERIFGILINALQDPVSKVRIEAIRALGFWANIADKTEIFENVSPLLHDHNLDVCRQAGLTLSRLQTEEAAWAIAEVLNKNTTPFSLKSELVQALSWIDHAASLTALEKILNDASEPMMLEILKVIARIDGRQVQANDVLLKFWQDKKFISDPKIRQTFVYALGELGQKESIDLLTQLAQDEEHSVKLHALAALKKFSSEEDPAK